MKKAGVVVVGPGLMGSQHIALINASDDCHLAAVVAPEKTGLKRVVSGFQGTIYPTLERCLEQETVDGVILSSPNEFHMQQALLCIDAGIPVLIEKPIACSVAQGRMIVQASEAKGTPVLVGHHRLHNPIIDKAREVIASGALGRIVSIVGSAQFLKPPLYFSEHLWRTRNGGGPILINLIHEISSLRALCGEIEAVQAVTSNRIRGFEVEDTAAINFVFESGALGAFVLSDTAATPMSWEHTSRENPVYPYSEGVDCYTIAGTLGSLSIPSLELRSFAEGCEPSWHSPFVRRTLSVERANPFQQQLAHFLRVIAGDVQPKVSAREGFRNLLIAEAVRQSALRQQMVQVGSVNADDLF